MIKNPTHISNLDANLKEEDLQIDEKEEKHEVMLKDIHEEDKYSEHNKGVLLAKNLEINKKTYLGLSNIKIVDAGMLSIINEKTKALVEELQFYCFDFGIESASNKVDILMIDENWGNEDSIGNFNDVENECKKDQEEEFFSEEIKNINDENIEKEEKNTEEVNDEDLIDVDEVVKSLPALDPSENENKEGNDNNVGLNDDDENFPECRPMIQINSPMSSSNKKARALSIFFKEHASEFGEDRVNDYKNLLAEIKLLKKENEELKLKLEEKHNESFALEEYSVKENHKTQTLKKLKLNPMGNINELVVPKKSSNKRKSMGDLNTSFNLNEDDEPDMSFCNDVFNNSEAETEKETVQKKEVPNKKKRSALLIEKATKNKARYKFKYPLSLKILYKFITGMYQDLLLLYKDNIKTLETPFHIKAPLVNYYKTLLIACKSLSKTYE